MLRTSVKVINPLGLHARAAAILVRLAGTFQSEITIKRADNFAAADAKSILSVLTLAAANETELEIETDGADAHEALKAVEEIFINGFGEI
ncbi:MAG: HPr family phosphocarrier protein [Pyrinomonadaceae bacterium]|nr:HPr family phosphocarrier protein [Pyrinomonadaceae bacterium]